ncbi:erythromycin esterase family protein [Flavobacterium sp.]|uniref:erythromycin esterase family protein n=1 Tax=Flavobacterium sp. TaxID=239 RepID=UPI0025C198DD|nr:erythromycin esterase family protein [Flavobacterium sp.]
MTKIIPAIAFFCFCIGFCQQSTLAFVDKNSIDLASGNYLSVLSDEVKSKTVVALGEASHGTHEFSAEKSKIIRHLIAKSNFRTIGFEFGYSAIEEINQYVLTGKGDLKELMVPLKLFDTQEFFDLFESIGKFNVGKSPKDKVDLYGFDTDFYKSDNDASAKFCLDYLLKNPDKFKNGKASAKAFENVTKVDYVAFLSDEDKSAIAKLQLELSLLKLSDAESRKFKKSVSLLFQGTLLSDPLARDEFMAKNALDFQSDTKNKMIVWGHNVHLAKDTTMAQCRGMGFYLREKLSDKYYAVGFDTFRGKVTILGENDFEHKDFEAKPDSFSAELSKAKSPSFLLLLDDTKNPIYGKDSKITNIFANFGRNLSLTMRPGIDFDALIFIRETTPTITIKR